MSLLLSHNIDDKKNNNINDDPENLIKSGIDTIYRSFNSNIENYNQKIKEQKKIINDLTKKLELMKEEMEMIQRENQYYKTQNEKLKNEIENLNKVVNSIKGKLTKFDFDFNINNKKIKEENELNMYINNNLNKKQQKLFITHKKDIYAINNIKYENNNFIKDKPLGNNEYSNNSKILKNDFNPFKINNINESDINNVDNNIDLEQEINIDNFQKNFNIDNELNNINEIIGDKKSNKNFLYNNFKLNVNDHANNLNNNINSIYNNTTNFKIKNKNYNHESIKLKKNTNKSFDISSAINIKNKNKNINFNDKNESLLQKKLNDKNQNKSRSNSSNNVIIKENNFNEIQNFATRYKNGNENSFPLLNEKPLINNIYNNFDNINNNAICDNKICQTFQNLNGEIDLKDIKMKEMTLFLKKCKVYLDQSTFEKVVKVFQDYKKGIISDNIIVDKIKQYLKNNIELLNSFKNIISK